MKQFEYTIFKLTPNAHIAQFMNAFGQLGWEAFHFDGEQGLFFCKREITLAGRLGLNDKDNPTTG